MFTLHGLVKSQTILLVCDLLVGKNGTDYERSFQSVTEEDGFNIESILTDFEAATIKATNSLFPNVFHKGNGTAFLKIAI